MTVRFIDATENEKIGGAFREANEGPRSVSSYLTWLKAEMGYEEATLIAMIGHTGSKIHRISAVIKATENEGEYRVADVRSYCGSQKFAGGHVSNINVLGFATDTEEITRGKEDILCQKCKGWS